jgi:alanine racemase
LDHLIRPTRAEVDLSAVANNHAVDRRLAAPAGVLAVVKANAYGHGAALVANALEEAGVDLLAVALVEEGLELRNAGVRAPILVIGGAYDGGYEALVANDLVPVVFREDQLEALARIARATHQRVKVHLKVDTGMGRIGVTLDQLEALLAKARALPELEIDGLASHLANADVQDSALNGQQVEGFLRAYRQLKAAGFAPRWRHLSNSAAVLGLPEARDAAVFNLVRPGLLLYGHAPAEHLSREGLRPVLSWKTAVSHLKTVPAGTPVSYGSIWTAPRESRIATLPVGYADGYDRIFSNRAQVLIRGHRAPVVGRVCMDMCMVDVTDVPGSALHDEVVLLGAQGEAQVDATELARLADTIPYEILCGIGARVPRVAV